MKTRSAGLAVTGMFMALASPAAAEGREAGGGEAREKAPRGAEMALPRREARSVQSIVQRRARLPEISQGALVAGPQPPMLGTVPLTGQASVGVGLFSIVGATEKEMVRRRTDPSLSVRPRDGKVAAVGLNLRF